MGKIKEVTLSETTRKELEQGLKIGKQPAFRKRCQIVLLKSQGRSSEEVGKIIGVCDVSVNNWTKRYLIEGVAGLHTRPGRGRPPKLDVEKDAPMVRNIVTANRQQVKLGKVEIEKNVGTTLSMRTLHRFLKKLTAAIEE